MKQYYRMMILLIVVLIAIIVLLVLYKFATKRKRLTVRETMDPGLPNVTPAEECQNLKSLYVDGVTLTSMVNTNLNTNLPINNYCIKASYNSACSGYNVSTDALAWVISRGCRYLDLEVHSMIDADKNVTPIIKFANASNYISFSDALNTIASNAFTSPNSPNSNDPLFLNLRIFQDKSPTIYYLVSISIQNILGTFLFKGPVTGKTLFSVLKGKIVLSCDKTINPDFLNISNYPGCSAQGNQSNQPQSSQMSQSQTQQISVAGQKLQNIQSTTNNSSNNKTCYDLANLINIQSGDDVLAVFSNSSIATLAKTPPSMIDISGSVIKDISGSGALINMQSWRIVNPDNPNAYTNTNSFQLFVDYGIQIVTNKFYKIDRQISLNETFFNTQKSAFVPLSVAISYASNPSLHLIDATYPKITF